MTTTKPIRQAENRLARFNADRDRIIQIVVERVVESYLDEAETQEDHDLEYVLNDCAYSELKRLEGSSAKTRDRQIARWRHLAVSLGRMSESGKRAELRKLVGHYAGEVAGNFDPRVYRFANDIIPPAVSLLLSPVHGLREGVRAVHRWSERIAVEGELELIHAACDQGTVVFAPTHSSNLDSVVIGLALKIARLPPVTYGAGKNLFTNPLISFFMHNLGAYKIDRRLRFRLYKEVLKEYSAVLLERGYHSLFFPGGTRSRSNVLESHLKLGLLGTAMEAYQNNLRARVERSKLFVVPVTINYRLVLEGETLIDDYLAEEGKSRYIIEDDEFSRLGRIVDFFRKTLAHEGGVVIRFGRPRDIVGHAIDDSLRSLDTCGRVVDLPKYFQGRDGDFVRDPQRDHQYTRNLGRVLAADYRAETLILPTHLVSRAIYNLVAQRVGTRDILRLVRLPASAIQVQTEAVCKEIDRLQKVFTDRPEWGRLHDTTRQRGAKAILEESIRAISSYHTRTMVQLQGDHIQVCDVKLLYYYQNRTAHAEPEIS